MSEAYPTPYIMSEYYDQELHEAIAKDMVNSPAHYADGNIECIDYLKDNMPRAAFLGYLEGNYKKYLHRMRYKGKALEDLHKASWYLNRLIDEIAEGGLEWLH